MKKKLIILTSVLFSCAGEKNFEDLQKIESGMNVKQVDSIMRSQPHSKDLAFWSDSLFVYYYESSFGASDDYKIIFKKRDSSVVKVELGE